MSEITTDACFSTVEVENNIVFGDSLLVDSSRNLHVNQIFCEQIHSKYFQQSRNFDFIHPKDTENPFDEKLIYRIQGHQNTMSSDPNGSFTLGGHINEAVGKNSINIGGSYNECTGDNSVNVGGEDNCANGACSISMGINSKSLHDNSFVWNSDSNTNLLSTNNSQFIINPINGFFQSLPKTTSIQSHMIHEGFACL